MIVVAADDQLYGHAKDCADLLESVGITNAHALVRDWIRRGLVAKVTEFDGRPVYAMAEIYRVELATRRQGKRGRRLDFASTITHAMS